jgi:hypothetical protein
MFKLTWWIVCDPNRIELAKSREFLLKLFFLDLVGQISNVDSCAAFVAHLSIDAMNYFAV